MDDPDSTKSNTERFKFRTRFLESRDRDKDIAIRAFSCYRLSPRPGPLCVSTHHKIKKNVHPVSFEVPVSSSLLVSRPFGSDLISREGEGRRWVIYLTTNDLRLELGSIISPTLFGGIVFAFFSVKVASTHFGRLKDMLCKLKGGYFGMTA
ncbi:hypothetical protein K474DRAFT_1672516 [Panus rudis PR-1116 ss-1]|nr:hypothetical protein K474DRAFT_1672516 [Panus rudis PR-1116 ss-1]